MQQNKHTTYLKKDMICKDGSKLLKTKGFFLFMIQGKMGVQRGKSHDEHSKHPMLIGRRFYPE